MSLEWQDEKGMRLGQNTLYIFIYIFISVIHVEKYLKKNVKMMFLTMVFGWHVENSVIFINGGAEHSVISPCKILQTGDSVCFLLCSVPIS